jgi:hypothetical protein
MYGPSLPLYMCKLFGPALQIQLTDLSTSSNTRKTGSVRTFPSPAWDIPWVGGKGANPKGLSEGAPQVCGRARVLAAAPRLGEGFRQVRQGAAVGGDGEAWGTTDGALGAEGTARGGSG